MRDAEGAAAGIDHSNGLARSSLAGVYDIAFEDPGMAAAYSVGGFAVDPYRVQD